MFRRMLLITPCALLMFGGATFSQTTTPAVDGAPPLTVASDKLFKENTDAKPVIRDEKGFMKASEGQILASAFIGQPVYNSNNDDAETIGKLHDFVLGSDGAVQAAIIGVGGFLGIGSKDVAIGADQLMLSKRSDGKKWLIVQATKDELSAAPAFEKATLFPDGVADPQAVIDTMPTMEPAVPLAPSTMPASPEQDTPQPVPGTP